MRKRTRKMRTRSELAGAAPHSRQALCHGLDLDWLIAARASQKRGGGMRAGGHAWACLASRAGGRAQSGSCCLCTWGHAQPLAASGVACHHVGLCRCAHGCACARCNERVGRELAWVGFGSWAPARQEGACGQR